MKISDLFEAAGKPDAHTPGTANMWADPYISSRLLDIHLSQETDLASRKTPAIERTLEFILSRVPPCPLDILDLGCGPGLYTERLAAMGHRVTGMDISAASLTHAEKSAREKGLDITYLRQDYLDQQDPFQDDRYDLVMMIFTDFGVLDPDQRTALLERVFRTLRPGGIFIFDVLNTAWRPDPKDGKTWDLEADGFWRPGPCLTLSQTFAYETENPGLFLSQHLVIDDEGLEIYRFYTQTFDHRVLTELLTGHGFKDIRCASGILPDSALYTSEEVSFCRAEK